MKRLWLLVLTIIPFVNVHAISTYYSDYRDYKIGTTEVFELNDLLKVEEYKVYNTQVEIEHDDGYVPESSCQFKYEDEPYATYTVGPRSDRSKKWYQSLESQGGYINKITFYNMTPNTITELRIFNNSKQVSVTSDTSNVVDENKKTKEDFVQYQTYTFMFDPIPIKDFMIKTVADDKLNGIITFYYKNNEVLKRKVLADVIDFKDREYINEIIPIVGYLVGTEYANSYEKDYVTYYHCYSKPKVSTGIYKRIEEVDNKKEYIDIDDYKELHDYYIRDKVKISDKQITTSNFDLKDLVTYSTVENFAVVSNIDYSKNGTYIVDFIFNNDFIVEKDVKVNITKNNKTTTSTSTSNIKTTKPKETKTSSKSTTTKVLSTTKTITTKVKPTTTTSSTKSSNVENEVVTTMLATSNITTKESTSRVTKTTSLKVKSNNSSPTYNTYEDEEVLEVEPLNSTIEKEEKKEDKKDTLKSIIKIFLWISFIVLSIILIILKVKDKSKDSC